MLSNPCKPVTIYSAAVIIVKSFSTVSVKQNTEKGLHVTGIYPLNANTFEDDEFLSSYENDRPYSQVTESANAPSSNKDNSEEGTPAGLMKVSPEIIRLFPKAGPRKTGGRKHAKSGILPDIFEKIKLKTKEPERVKRSIQGKHLRRTL